MDSDYIISTSSESEERVKNILPLEGKGENELFYLKPFNIGCNLLFVCDDWQRFNALHAILAS